MGTVMKNLTRRATAVGKAIEDGQIVGTAFGIILGGSAGAIGILIATGGIVTTNVELQITLSTEFGILVPLAVCRRENLKPSRQPFRPEKWAAIVHVLT